MPLKSGASQVRYKTARFRRGKVRKKVAPKKA